jgi:hypothetical protein
MAEESAPLPPSSRTTQPGRDQLKSANRTPGKRQAPASRRWHVSIALKRDPALPEPLMEGTPILEESPGDLGVLLWKSYRDVILWGETDPAHRTDLFAPGSFKRREALIRSSSLTGEPRAAVELVTAALRDARGNPAEIVYCCRRIAEWASSHKKLYTAFAISIAAAAVAPEDATIALEVGRAAAARGLYVAAETWHRRAVGLARRGKDHSAYGEAWLELGSIYAARAATRAPEPLSIDIDPAGVPIEEVDRRIDPRISPELHSGADHPARARRSFLLAARAARRHGMRQTAGRAYAGLFRLASATGTMRLPTGTHGGPCASLGTGILPRPNFCTTTPP